MGNIQPKHMLIFIAVVALIMIMVWPNGHKIQDVLDGNTVILTNGAKAKLIGINSTKEGMNYLKEQQRSGLKVLLVPDQCASFDPEALDEGRTYYCYLLNENGECFNGTMLKTGLCDLIEEDSFVDSMQVFKKYAERGRRMRPTPPEPYHEVINYEDDDIILPDPPAPKPRPKDGEKAKDENGEIIHNAGWYASDPSRNLKMLEIACDYYEPYTKKFANGLAAKKPGNFSVDQVCEIYAYCHDKWGYVNDPNGHEYLARASESIQASLTGDCDDFAILIASCVLSVGGNACVTCGWGPAGGHAWAEVDINSLENKDINSIAGVIRGRFPQYKIDKIWTRNAKGTTWLNLDWQRPYPGGDYFQTTTVVRHYCLNGKWQI